MMMMNAKFRPFSNRKMSLWDYSPGEDEDVQPEAFQRRFRLVVEEGPSDILGAESEQVIDGPFYDGERQNGGDADDE